MTSVAFNRIFTDAASVEELAKLMNDWVYSTFSQTGQISQLPTITSYTSSALRYGMLVHPAAGGTIKAATITDSIPARGVVVEVHSQHKVTWAPLAIVQIRVRGSATVGYRPLWLSTQGNATLTEPTSGFRQQVGFMMDYDNERDLYTCFFNPSGGQGEAHGSTEIVYVDVADIDSPTELSAYSEGTVIAREGDKMTMYGWATSSTAKSPYVVAGDGGYWVAMAGQYVNT